MQLGGRDTFYSACQVFWIDCELVNIALPQFDLKNARNINFSI